jgi:hypothetical protein
VADGHGIRFIKPPEAVVTGQLNVNSAGTRWASPVLASGKEKRPV